MINFNWKSLFVSSFCLLCLPLLSGCGDDGPKRYALKGTVSYQGKPVPRGYIIFSPDSSQNNSGPGAQADIVDGNYETKPGSGVIGGPHRITISGYDGIPYQSGEITIPNGQPLFAEITQSADLPRQDGEYNLELP